MAPKGHNMAENITNRICTQRVKERTKIFDARCPGFYVSITPSGVATFAFRYWNNAKGKQDTVTIGEFHPERLDVEKARAEAFDMKARVGKGEEIKRTHTVAVDTAKRGGVTVNRLMDEFFDYIKTPVKKADGEKRPRTESWEKVQQQLERNVRRAIGKKFASEVTNHDIANIQATVARRSVSSARQTRSALNVMFKFAAEAGRGYVTASPCFNLPSLDKEYERNRVLSAEELRTLWWGLDDPNLPSLRSVSLGLKFALATMLRSQEFRTSNWDWLIDYPGEQPILKVPAKHVKKRRVIWQPLNSLAVEVLNEIRRTSNHQTIFYTRALAGETILNRHAFASALRGKDNRPGIIEYLGMEPFTPHDLRRTAASLAADYGCSTASIAHCLDHSKDRGEDVVETPSVTGRVYVQSKRLAEKREVLNTLDRAIREIVGNRPARISKHPLAA